MPGCTEFIVSSSFFHLPQTSEGTRTSEVQGQIIGTGAPQRESARGTAGNAADGVLSPSWDTPAHERRGRTPLHSTRRPQRPHRPAGDPDLTVPTDPKLPRDWRQQT